MFAHIVGGTPAELVSFKKEKAFQVNYKNLKSPLKEQVVEALRKAQGNRCAYCETSIKNNMKVRIEHFHPQSRNGQGTGVCVTRTGGKNLTHSDLEYGNMLLCCDGYERSPGEPKTCDVRKGDEDICDHFFNPKLHNPGKTLVEVDSRGIVTPSLFPTSKHEAERVINDVLGLNDPKLCKNRERIYSSLVQEMNKRKINKHNKNKSMKDIRNKFADRLKKRAENSDYPSTILSVAKHVTARSR